MPNYADLFGNINFKKGDDSRSVYSPAAYLTDLLQLLDDEFAGGSSDFNTRRSDIKGIALDAENTTTLIPYLDIVNEILEGKVIAAGNGTDAYSILKQAVYPFNMPFSLDNEKLHNHLHHLGIKAHELRRLFATSTDYDTVAREFLGLAAEEVTQWLEVDAVQSSTVLAAYGYGNSEAQFLTDMAKVSTFMETTELVSAEVLELLYQKLYIDSANHTLVEDGRQYFYINSGLSEAGYVALSTDETTLEWYGVGSTVAATVPLEWYDRASRFVRFAKKIGLSFTELDQILRYCCRVNDVPTLNGTTLIYIAQVVYIHRMRDLPIATVVAILSEISFTGRTNEDLPQDQFNQIFNLPCVAVDEKYFHIAAVMGDLPDQYVDKTYKDYTRIEYFTDLFSDANDTYRKRLLHTLGFTETDLINITERLEFEEVVDSSLWESTANEWRLLNILYRIRALTDVLDVSFLELFTLFDLLEQDPFIGRFDPHNYFVYSQPTTQKCFEILINEGSNSLNVQSSDTVATFYDGDNYTKSSFSLGIGRHDQATLLAAGMIGPASINSVTVAEGLSVTLYRYDRFNPAGGVLTITNDTPLLGEFRFSNTIASIVITKAESEIESAFNISDRLWLVESLIALTNWMKEYGYSADMLWKIVNAAPRTDAEEEAQEKEHLALFNNLLASFEAEEITPATLNTALGDERAAQFAYDLLQKKCANKKGDRQRKGKGYQKKYKQAKAKAKAKAGKSHPNMLFAYKPREAEDLARDFIQQLMVVRPHEFVDLKLEGKLVAKITRNLVIHQVLDAQGMVMAKEFKRATFTLAKDFSDWRSPVWELFNGVYQKDAAGQAEGDSVEVQVFKSDLKSQLGISESDARELYDNLIYNGYIDAEGTATNPDYFQAATPPDDFSVATGLETLTEPVRQLIEHHLAKFKDSQVKISPQLFEALELDAVALADLMTNLQMNHYLDEQMVLADKMRLLSETPRTMTVALQFYPYREQIFEILQGAIASDKGLWLQLDQAELSKLAAGAMSQWIQQALQAEYLDGRRLKSEAIAFFEDEANSEALQLPGLMAIDASDKATIFARLASIVSYAADFRLKDTKLGSLDFSPEEITAVKQRLTSLGILDAAGGLRGGQVPFFLIPDNAARFNVPGFDDYDTDLFFQLYEIAKAIDTTVKNVNEVMQANSEAQQTAILEQLTSVLGIEQEAVKLLSEEIFKTEDNLHFAWLKPLLEEANAIGQLDELPDDMFYTQAVKRIGQLATLIKQQQLDLNEIKLLLEDQDLVDKFPEDIILPDGITAVDAILETDEFLYFFKDNYYWIYLAEDYTLIDKKEVIAGIEDDDDLIDLQRDDEELQERLKEDPIRQLFDDKNISKVDAIFIDRYETWVVVSGVYHYVRYANTEVWDRRDNHFGQVDNDFDNLEMIDSAYVDAEGRLFLFSNDKYVRYSEVNFTLDPSQIGTAIQPSVDAGYPKAIADDWNDENLPIQLPRIFNRDLGPMFDGLDDYSYAFYENWYVSSEDGQVRPVKEKWGIGEYDFGKADHVDAALAHGGAYYLFLDNRIVKYSGSIELANLQPEDGYPKPIHDEFTSLPDEFAAGIDGALKGLDGNIYLFRDDDFVTINPKSGETLEGETKSKWGLITNTIDTDNKVDAAFVGLDGYTYLFSGAQYVRYSGKNYRYVDDGFPRNIAEDWEGLAQVTAAFTLGNKTYLFGTTVAGEEVYVRYSILRKDEDDLLEYDEEDPNARVIETVLANRPDVDDIEVFPTTVNDDFWSLPESLTGGATNFQIDAVMNGPDDTVYLFYGDYYVKHDRVNRWWSEPKMLSAQWDKTVSGLDEGDRIQAAFTGTDGKTYLFYNSKFLRFSDEELRNLDNGYPRLTRKIWGRVKNNIDKTGKIDAALVVESHWEEQDDHGQLVDMTAMHTYLFSGDQFFRYEHAVDAASYDYGYVDAGYPRMLSRLTEEPRFKELAIAPRMIDAAFADQRQVYLFEGNSFHVTIGDEDNYKQYEHAEFTNIQAVTQEKGVNFVLQVEGNWQKLNHLEDRDLIPEAQTPRAAQKAEGELTATIDAILYGTDGKGYVFGGSEVYDIDLERKLAIADVFGNSRNPIYDEETIDAAFVGRDGKTYVFSGEWFVEYDSETYLGQTVTYPPRRISDKWRGLRNVALAYVWREETYLFERPDENGRFRYLRYSKDSYEQPDPGFPFIGDGNLWGIPEAYLAEGFAQIDAIFVQEDTMIFISDQDFIAYNLTTENWNYPRPLELIFNEMPFNRTDFQTLKSGFVGADGTSYFFSEATFVSYSPAGDWSDVLDIRDYWGLQNNILSNGIDAAWVHGESGTTYLFAGDSYVKYSGNQYRYIDAEYPKKMATYLLMEPGFDFMTKEFQQHLDQLEITSANSEVSLSFFDGILDNGRCIYVFTQNTVFTGSPNKFVTYDVLGLGHTENNFTSGGYVDAAFVDIANDYTYLFSGEQYIRYTGDRYRYMDQGYPKIIAEDLAAELKIGSLSEDFRDGIDAAFHTSALGLVLFNNKTYYTSIDGDRDGGTQEGNLNDVWGQLDNVFVNGDATVDGAYIDYDGGLVMFKESQFIRYDDTARLFALNPYNEARYIDPEYPREIDEIWSQLDSAILTSTGMDTVFKLEEEIHFHTQGQFVTYNLDLSDHDELKAVQILAYRWGEWSDYLLSDIHAISKFKDLGQRFSGGDLTLTELVTAANGEVREPYMQLAAIFDFEKEDVRWVKRRNCFLQSAVNVVEDDFHLEEILRLYDILATTQRIRADVSELYNNVWLKLYDRPQADLTAAATGAYNVLVQVDCNNNYETLVKQIVNELNTIKRDAMVPYIIASDNNGANKIINTRQLYQQLLIDIQMDSCAETSRIVEAIAAVQLYLHRYFINLETVQLAASDQQATRATLKDRWQWLRSYRVWEANRKVFLYPENYLRPELRDLVTPGFEALEESLSQGQLNEDAVNEAYFKYLDHFTEVSELTIAGGYVYDDNSSGTNDKKLVLLGRTRTDPMRYYYRFGSFINGNSAESTWEPWEELDISIEATRVEPVYAFNRVFIFWATVEESADDASSAVVTTTDNGNGRQNVSSSKNTTHEVKVYYSFYNLNKRWTQPQLLQTTFTNSPYINNISLVSTTNLGATTVSNYQMTSLKTSLYLSNIDIFVENAARLTQNNSNHNYENIYISVRFYGSETYNDANPSGPHYRAYNLTPELYSQEAAPQSVGNRGQALFANLFPAEGGIDEENTVMLNYSADSVDGPWFAYNHNGCGFLVKPDVTSIASTTGLTPTNTLDIFPNLTTLGFDARTVEITAAVQPFADGPVYYFLSNGAYTSVTKSTDAQGKPSYALTDAQAISSRWGIESASAIAVDGLVDAGFAIADRVYLTLGGKVYEYDGASFSTLRVAPYNLTELVANLPASWTEIQGGFTYQGITYLFNGQAVFRSDTKSTTNLASTFELSQRLGLSAITTMVVYGGQLHVITNGSYIVYNSDGTSTTQANAQVKTVVQNIFGNGATAGNGWGNATTVLMPMGDGLWTINTSNQQGYYNAAGVRADKTFPTPLSDSTLWTAGCRYTDSSGILHYLMFSTGDGIFLMNAWSETGASTGKFSQVLTNRSLANIEVVAALTTVANQIVVVTRVNNAYYYQTFNNSESPTAIYSKIALRNGVDAFANLTLETLLDNGTTPKTVDAAFVGTGALGNTNAVYLFFGDRYARFTDNGNGGFANTPDSGYPKALASNTEGFPAWTRIDAAVTTPMASGSNAYKSHFFIGTADNSTANELCYTYDSTTESGSTSSTRGVWGAVPYSNLQRAQRVDAAYVADGYLYLILNRSTYGVEYYRYTLPANGSAVPEYFDSNYPKLYYANRGVSAARFAEYAASIATSVSSEANILEQNASSYGDSGLFMLATQLRNVATDLNNYDNLRDLEIAANDLQAIADDLNFLVSRSNNTLSAAGISTLQSIRSRLSSYISNMNSVAESFSLNDTIDAAFMVKTYANNNFATAASYYVYLFSGTDYYRFAQNTRETDFPGTETSIAGSWGNIPSAVRSGGLDGAVTVVDGATETLYLLQNNTYVAYDMRTDTAAKPYEIDEVKYEVIRLTSSTAEQLNQILFAGGVKALLKMSTQEINESPTISFATSTPDNIQMNAAKFTQTPTNTHLDFNSANGLYYWEVFFHAPFLIAQTLNTDQQFEYAKEWYEYIFDPTEVSDYWKFLPFLAADPDALVATLSNDLTSFASISTETGNNASYVTAQTALDAFAAVLAPYQDVFLGKVDLTIYESQATVTTVLANIETWPTFINLVAAIGRLNVTAAASTGDQALLATWQSEMSEVIEILKKLDYRIDLMAGTYNAQIAAYLADPFDPHAIAALRPLAYRKAIVMRYIDNVLDWGDMLFRQYTRESINEARMLYILAYDLLGERPDSIGRVVLENTKSYSQFSHYTGQADSEANAAYDFLIDLENSGANANIAYEQSLSFAATQFDTIKNPYFFLKENELFTEYWTRVEDRLGKIRACLNIDGIAQPLPLFQPPIDPMALVNAAASGGGALAAALAGGGSLSVPDYRFDSMLSKARELVGKLKTMSDNLLSAIEKKDAEDLSILQNKQEAMALALVTKLKELQIEEAEESLANLEVSKARAEEQERHYAQLIGTGYIAEEITQMNLMKASVALNGVVALGRLVSGLSYIGPQVTLGPFSFGATAGGKNIGDMLSQFAEGTQSAGEALSMAGEVVGITAQHKRSKEDWRLQKAIATFEIAEIESQILAQQVRIEMAKQEQLMHAKDIENNEAIATFMKEKFSNTQLYNWMSGRISSVFFQTYKLAHDYAKQAEQAFIFEKGVKAGDVNFISGMYWDSQRKGLLAGSALELDLDRMAKAYDETDTRVMEITKNISLLELDPMALLSLKTKGYCTFRLSEELFDYDFPGHYKRQIKTISLAFDIGEGQTINATLTQLSSKMVMATDIKGVKHLMDPSNEATTNVRANWRANQQVALSHVDQYTENNGMFELNFGDARYLPFEGTGAVSNWRLEINGKKGSYNPADLLDVTVKLRYTAKQGGDRFANEVKGILKPYNATSFLDLAYNFPDEWAALTQVGSDAVTITLTRDMFPNMSSSKIIGLFVRYEYAGDGGSTLTINDALQVPNNTYVQPSNLSVGQNGSDWTFTFKGDATTVKNAEMVLVYKAKV